MAAQGACKKKEKEEGLLDDIKDHGKGDDDGTHAEGFCHQHVQD